MKNTKVSKRIMSEPKFEKNDFLDNLWQLFAEKQIAVLRDLTNTTARAELKNLANIIKELSA